jgi:hypothetical protein
VTLSAFSLLSFAGRIAGIASRLPLGFLRGPLSEFRIARLLLGLQAGLTSGSLGKLRGHLSALTIWTHSQGVYPLRNASTMGASPAKHLIGLCQEVPPFALDSQLEGEGFEPSVPRQGTLFETAPFELAFPMGSERTAASNLYSSTAEYG